jgi:hypothetical protein
MKSIKPKKNKIYFRAVLNLPEFCKTIGSPIKIREKVVGKILDTCGEEVLAEIESKYVGEVFGAHG